MMKRHFLSGTSAVTGEGFERFLPFIQTLPKRFEQGEGQVIYQGRNELRQMRYEETEVVVKSFRLPNLNNRIAYGWLRSSKAER